MHVAVFVLTVATSHAANSDERWLYGHQSHGNIALKAPFSLCEGLRYHRNTFIFSLDCRGLPDFALFRQLQTYHVIL
jgi:hypothetical protein